MYLKTTVLSLSAALALMATPALAAHGPKDNGKTTAPGQLCKSQSHKKTSHGKGKSPFAACVAGVKLAEAESAKDPSMKTPPGQLCKDLSHKKGATDVKSPFAACVTGAADAEHGA